MLEPYVIDLRQAESELTSFETWLNAAGFVSETDIIREIRKRPSMLCLLGPVGAIPAADLFKWELGLQGLYRTDLVLGNHRSRSFLLIEFEGAEEFSVFKGKGTAQYRNWSPQLEHGFGQVVDWAALRAAGSNPVMQNTFKGDIAKSTFLVICGRDAGIHAGLERQRFNFRRDNVQIQGLLSQVLTYDDMVGAMRDALEAWKTLP